MGKVAFLFSGQGAQHSGMGRSLYESSTAAKAVFEKAEQMRSGIINLCFNGTDDELKQTINAQVALFTVSMAGVAVMAERGIYPDMTAGFSVGEMAALVTSGKLDFKNGFRLTQKRAELMQMAAEKNKGTMAAVLGLSAEDVVEVCNEIGAYAVNFNCEGQTVIAGSVEALEKAKDVVKEKKGKLMPLKVSGAFHSPFMNEAADGLRTYLEGLSISEHKIPIYSNVTASVYNDNSLIYRQVNHPVLWQKTIENMITDGATSFVELGAGNVLSGLLKKINKVVEVITCDV